jgi:ubiquinone/menaquinone biosynthesis C-methylase UbiE
MNLFGLLSHPAVFDLQQRLGAANHRPVKRWVADALRLRPEERVIDVCCGTGSMASVVPGNYLGIDFDPRSIAWARRKFSGDASKRFLVADVTELALEPKSFHKALFIDGLHHLPDDRAVGALRIVSRITRDAVAIVDPAPETRRPLSRLLLALDMGRHIRPLAAQMELIRSGGFIVESHRTLYSGLAHKRIFLCRPVE